MQRLRSRLPPLDSIELTHFDSYGLLNLYNEYNLHGGCDTAAGDVGRPPAPTDRQ
jgi:hypothetical protein